MTMTAPETATAARAVDAVKTHGAGAAGIDALAEVSVDVPTRRFTAIMRRDRGKPRAPRPRVPC